MEEMLRGAAVVGQSGGPTAAINAALAGVIKGYFESRGAVTKLYGMKNGIVFNGSRNDAMELCARIHPLTAEVLGTYEIDFYAGEAALTKNKFGKGEAYYIAARTGSDMLSVLYGEMIETLHIEKALDCALPHGVTAHIRHGEKENIIFVENYTESGKTVELPRDYKLYGTDQTVNSIKLAPFGIALLSDLTKV